MEEIIENLGEQPAEQGSPVGEESQIEVGKTSEAERGVPVGKFNSVDDLYQAYNNLQTEFTKKCQKLSELEKEKIAKIPNPEKLEAEWMQFLSKNRDAVSYADEIKNKVLFDENMKMLEKPFDVVWANMLYEKMTAQNKEKEPMVQNFVLNDEKIKNLIIEDYVKQLQAKKTPIVMSSEKGETVTKVSVKKPDSFERAKQVVLDLLT